ncbi:hypothetical protein [Candidatus Enterococcus ikei]|uniref:Uncharacterized protein n=1 Tax=Candidatus Enterococcus ikei TaxID=2815326 RepID=A0ABS3H1P9_9ENTE|nr:hypothetical protein [Enterococcus sp. DIV0869a]MBO0441432.1 hypothetical protein [Enterococcus sp. DIV0869a]
MNKEYIPLLKENSVLVKNDSKYILKSCSLEDNYLEINDNAQIIIDELAQKKDIENIYQSILSKSNTKNEKLIMEQVDLFLFQLQCLREYLEDDETGYLLKRFLNSDDTTVDPFGAYTKKEIFDNELQCKSKNFYYREKSFLDSLFYSSFTANKMFSVVEKNDSIITVVIFKHLEDIDSFELIAVFSNNNVIEQKMFSRMYNVINIYTNLFFKKSIKKSSKVVIKSDNHIQGKNGFRTSYCGILKYENGKESCNISILELNENGDVVDV